MKKQKPTLALLVVALASLPLFAQGYGERGVRGEEKETIKVLILPKFEVGEMTGDFPGEAQYYYDAYVKGGEEYDVKGGFEDHKLYVRDGVALYVTGMGKVNCATSLCAILQDDRFDLSDAYVLSTGCGGSAFGSTVMGDVFVITAAIDGDLGHTADWRDLSGKSETTWFHASDYDSSSCRILDPNVMEKVYSLVKDVKVETTPKTKNFIN